MPTAFKKRASDQLWERVTSPSLPAIREPDAAPGTYQFVNAEDAITEIVVTGPPPSLTVSATIALGQIAVASTLTVFNQAPVTLTQTAQGTLAVSGPDDALFTVTITQPAYLAAIVTPNGPGVFVSNAALLNGGPVNLIQPRIARLVDADADGVTSVGDTIGLPAENDWSAVAFGGIWAHNGTMATVERKFQRNGVDIPGAVGNTYVLGPADAGQSLTMVETVTDANGTRSVSSLPIVVAALAAVDDIQFGNGKIIINALAPLGPDLGVSFGNGKIIITGA